jgi:hypothetical protein
MPETCTCGTILAENARFCHRCGRPVYPETAIAEVEDSVDIGIAQTPPVTIRPAPLPVGFGNPVALRVAFLMSLGIVVVQFIPGLNLLSVLWWLAAGWCAVLLYHRTTGLVLSVRAGARLGSITGVLTFASTTVIISVTLLFAGKEVFQQMIRQNPQISAYANDPGVLIPALLFALAVLFALIVGVCAAGGALCAKWAAGRGPAAN